jgi:hypothetical protein
MAYNNSAYGAGENLGNTFATNEEENGNTYIGP